MTNAQWVFEKALHLMDEVDDRTGEIVQNEVRDFQNRTIPILNVLREELFCRSDRYRTRLEQGEGGARPLSAQIDDMETPIDLDDALCQSVLPYGLAAHLLLAEEPSKASFFQQRYEELRERYERTLPAAFAEIEAPYGGIEAGAFGRW